MHLIGLSFSQMNESSYPQEPFGHWFPDNHYLDSFFRWDSGWYKSIIQGGYSYNTEKQSNVAFFPLYPILVKAIASLTSLNVPISGLLLSNLCLILALFFVYKISNIYLNKRGCEKVLILMLVFPTPAAMIPACRIPPPNTFLTRRALRMKSFDPMRTDPTGAPNPLLRQSEMESNSAA